MREGMRKGRVAYHIKAVSCGVRAYQTLFFAFTPYFPDAHAQQPEPCQLMDPSRLMVESLLASTRRVE